MNPVAARRRPEVLVAPVVTFAAVVLLVGVARIYDRLPVQAPECRFKSVFGVPCVGCGATRSMQALAQGDVVGAITLNPAIMLGVFFSIVWLGIGVKQFVVRKPPLGVAEQNRRLRIGVFVTFTVLVLNWIYLLVFLR